MFVCNKINRVNFLLQISQLSRQLCPYEDECLLYHTVSIIDMYKVHCQNITIQYSHYPICIIKAFYYANVLL